MGQAAWYRCGVSRRVGPIMIAATALALSCATEEPTPPEKPEFTRVTGAPAPAAKEPDRVDLAVEGYARAMGANPHGAVLGTSAAVYAVDVKAATPLEVVGDEPDLPAETGAVHAMAKFEDGVLVAATNGLFVSREGALQLSKASADLASLDITSLTSRTDEQGATTLGVVAAGRAYELAPAEGGATLLAWTIDGEAGQATAVFAQPDRVVASFGRTTYEIDKETLKAKKVAFDLGDVRAIACDSDACEEGSLLYFASDAGLVERAADGSYTLFTLAEDDAPSPGVQALALDGTTGRVYALAGDRVLRVRAGEIPEVIATAPVDPSAEGRAMTVDALGDVWIGASKVVAHFAVAAPIRFATDVKPVLHAYCADCHKTGANGAPKIDYEDYDVAVERIDSILMRVKGGSMPPLTSGKTLPKDKIKLLEAWSTTKTP